MESQSIDFVNKINTLKIKAKHIWKKTIYFDNKTGSKS